MVRCGKTSHDVLWCTSPIGWILPGICWRHLVAWRSQESARPLINLIGPPLLTDGYSAIQAESTSHSIYGCGAGCDALDLALCSLLLAHAHNTGLWNALGLLCMQHPPTPPLPSETRSNPDTTDITTHISQFYLSWNKGPTEVWSVVWGDLLSSAL